MGKQTVKGGKAEVNPREVVSALSWRGCLMVFLKSAQCLVWDNEGGEWIDFEGVEEEGVPRKQPAPVEPPKPKLILAN